MTKIWTLSWGLVGAIALAACTTPPQQAGSTPADSAADSTTTLAQADEAETGTLEIYVSGEDRLQTGFTSGDGWDLTFDHVYISLASLTAFQTDPPFDPDAAELVQGDVSVSLESPLVIDLVNGDPDEPEILIGELSPVPTGQYNAMVWEMAAATEGPAEGYSIVFEGTATRDGETVDFVFQVEQEYNYQCGEFVGDVRGGIVTAGETSFLEATFHLDHVFGVEARGADDALNLAALGFDPLAELAEDGRAEVNLARLEAENPEAFEKVSIVLAELGHTGEGHCYEAVSGVIAG